MSADEISQARRLFYGEHWKIGTIAAHLGRHPDAIRRAINSNTFNRKGREVQRLIDPYLDFVKETLCSYPRLRATRIYEMLVSRGYRGSISQLRRTVQALRPGPSKEAFMKLKTLPGEQAQVDWANFGEIQIGGAARKLSAFVMVLSWSRAIHALFTLDQQQGNFLRGHVESFAYFGGVPRVLFLDYVTGHIIQIMCPKQLCGAERWSSFMAGSSARPMAHNWSEFSEPFKQCLVRTPDRLPGECRRNLGRRLARLQRGFLCANADFRVPIGGVETDMAKPAADYVHLDSCLQQVNGRRVTKNMRPDATKATFEVARVAAYDLIDAEARKRVAGAGGKDMMVRRVGSRTEQSLKLMRGLSP